MFKYFHNESASVFAPAPAPLVLVPGSLALSLALAALGHFATTQGRSGRTLLGQGRWEHLLGKVKHFTEVLNALIGQGVVVPTPAVDLSQVVTGGKGPQDHHHVQVWDVLQLIVLAGLWESNSEVYPLGAFPFNPFCLSQNLFESNWAWLTQMMKTTQAW